MSKKGEEEGGRGFRGFLCVCVSFSPASASTCRLRSLHPYGCPKQTEGKLSIILNGGRNRWPADDSAPSIHTPARGRTWAGPQRIRCRGVLAIHNWPNPKGKEPWGRTRCQQALRLCKAAALGTPISVGVGRNVRTLVRISLQTCCTSPAHLYSPKEPMLESAF